MGGVETSRDGGATHEATKVVLVVTVVTMNCCGGGRMPRWGKYKEFKTRIYMNKNTRKVQSR